MITKETLDEAISRVQRLIAGDPEVTAYQAIEAELRYLQEHITGGNDGSRLKDLNLGLLAVREVDDVDPETGRLLHDLSNDVPRLQKRLP